MFFCGAFFSAGAGPMLVLSGILEHIANTISLGMLEANSVAVGDITHGSNTVGWIACRMLCGWIRTQLFW
jgi:hypothetical protein